MHASESFQLVLGKVEQVSLVDGHRSDDRLDVADVVKVELEAHDDSFGGLAAQLFVDALLKPVENKNEHRMQKQQQCNAVQ